MNKTPRQDGRYWQVMAGSFGRDYTEDFFRYGMAFVGGKNKIATMSRVRAGDRMILKRGRSEVAAVGVVVERDGRVHGNMDKPWLRDFDGWDLSAYCFVEWHVPPLPIANQSLTRGTIQEAHKTDLRKIADRVLSEVPAATFHEREPAPTRTISDSEMLEFLVREGLRPAAAEELTTVLRRIRLLARYYYDRRNWKDVREHETRSFLILPLLLALGWPEQQIKIELGIEGARKRIDVACFARPYRRDSKGRPNDEDCVLILESKGFSQGLDYAPEQAREYAEHFPQCRVVVVSNGYCYKAYARDADGAFQLTPSAYLNVLNLQDRYPRDPEKVQGCLEVLRLLLPGLI